ncbi:glycosyltransferase [Aspergillus undulatus]|uniref:glycosyltransferase n=1 Tax=Aspergillus undulatus TaxID=1810928 RepID=UPI003CCE0A88
MNTYPKSLIPGGSRVRDDGRIEVNLDSKACKVVAELIGTAPAEVDQPLGPPPPYEDVAAAPPIHFPVRLNIVIQVVGSRGDVQPFIALGNELQKHGHRVRLATHDVFASFVRDSGLEFYPIGGDPAELMAYMVKNPGLIPQLQSLRAGEVQRKREMVAAMLDGCWKSCIEDDPISGKPFVAEVIIANPPSFAHVHCAQALGVPLHLMFTMPWSSTRAIPHPLANLRYEGTSPEVANWFSYGVVEWLTWQGLGDVINGWRSKLGLEFVPVTEGPMLVETLKVPFTYCWSSALMAKPADWPAHIDVCGFFFRDTPVYSPPKSLEMFLSSGPPPVYIGFGSIVIDNPEQFTATILEAIRLAGTRAIISRGWSKLGGEPSDNIYYVDDCPHEWLFQRVSAVVHHGGAGTTACGLRYGRPTAIIPFFGDQPFWGNLVASSGAGSKPIPYRTVNATNLTEVIKFCLQPETQRAAQTIASKMQHESGVRAAVDSFHRNLPLDRVQCDLLPDQATTWTCKSPAMRLSKLAAQILVEHLRLSKKNLQVYEPKPIIIENRRWDPLTGAASAAIGTSTSMVKSTADIFLRPYQEYQDLHRDRGRPSTSLGLDKSATPRSLSSPPQTTSTEHPITQNSDSNPSLTPTATPTTLQATTTITSASAKSIGRFLTSYFKGVMVDIPLATAEGLRAVPRLYGEESKGHGPVKDWKSGFVVGYNSFSHGMVDGLSGLVTQPCKGAKEEGALGAVKGVAKGAVGVGVHVGSAALGLVAYPGQGICKSIHSAVRSRTRQEVTKARIREGEYLARAGVIDRGAVIRAFEAGKRRDGDGGARRFDTWDIARGQDIF